MSIHRSSEKLTKLTVEQYDGEARPGELVVDSATYQLYIGNSQGNLNLVNGGGGHAAGQNEQIQFNALGNFGASEKFTFDGNNVNLSGTLNVENGVNSPTGHLQIGTVASNGSAIFGNVSVAQYLETNGFEVDGTARINDLYVSGEANLGTVASVVITGGANGQILTTDGTGNLSWNNPPANGVTQINTGTGLTGGPITTTGTIALTNTGVNNGTYTLPTITVDPQGRTTNISSATDVSVPGNLTVVGTTSANGNVTVGGSLTVTDNVSIDGEAFIAGNLTVDGNVTFIDSNVVVIDDLYVVLANGASNANAATGAGIRIYGANANFTYSAAQNAMTLNTGLAINSGLLTFPDSSTQNSAYPGNATDLTIANLSVTQSADLGSVHNITITGGADGQVLTTDGTGNVTWENPTGNAAGANGDIQFNNNGDFAATPALNYNTVSGALSAPAMVADSVAVAGEAQVGTLAVDGGIAAGGNLDLGDFDVIAGNALIDGNVRADSVYATSLQSEYSNLGSATNLTIMGGTNGQVLSTDGAGNVSWANVPVSGNVLVTSNVTSLVTGAALQFAVDYTNPSYPGGVFTLFQSAPAELTIDGTWASGGYSKNAYANYAASQINSQNVNLNLTLTSGSTFDIQASDDITIGSSVITGNALLALNITGTGGSYVIPAASVVPAQIANSSGVTANLTTSEGIKFSGAQYSLQTVAPIPFAITGLSGAFPETDIPFWEPNQSFQWNASGVGTVLSGNVTLSGSANANLTTTGAMSGTSPSINSTTGPFTITASYTGNGQYGAGVTTVSGVTANVTPADPIEPLMWKYTMSNANPDFTTADNHYNTAFEVGQGAMTSSNVNQYLWIAIPANVVPQPGFQFQTGIGPANVTTTDYFSNVSISGSQYNLYGFNDFNAAVLLYTYSI